MVVVLVVTSVVVRAARQGEKVVASVGVEAVHHHRAAGHLRTLAAGFQGRRQVAAPHVRYQMRVPGGTGQVSTLVLP